MPALRPGDVRGRQLPRHHLPAACRRRAPRTRRSGANGMFATIATRARSDGQPVQGLPRLLRRPLGADERLRRRRHASVRHRPRVRDRAAAGLPGMSRPTAIAAHELLHALGAVAAGRPAPVSGRLAGTRATRRPTCSTRSPRAARSARSCSTSTTTTTTATPAPGPTSRIRSGCTGSTCRRSRLGARVLRRRARSRATCPASTAPLSARRSGIRARS